MTRQEVCSRIQEIGIIPAIRARSSDDALFAAETVNRGGIPVAEITVTVPESLEVISHLSRTHPDMIVGAGTVLDIEMAKRCVDAGAKFLTNPGLVVEVVEFAVKNEIAVLPGALTPTEVITAWKAGADFVKVFPCAQVGGESYIRALKTPLPQIPLIAAGGVNQQTALNFILSGASALGIGTQLIPKEALQRRLPEHILELARRFIKLVKEARSRMAPR